MSSWDRSCVTPPCRSGITPARPRWAGTTCRLWMEIFASTALTDCALRTARSCRTSPPAIRWRPASSSASALRRSSERTGPSDRRQALQNYRSVSFRGRGGLMTFTVSIDERDIVFACETGETVLDAAEHAGYSLPYSCRKGVCSTCEGELRRGTVSVGSKQFDGPAGGVLLCQARPQSGVLIHPKRIERHDPDARKRVAGNVHRIKPPARERVNLPVRLSP